MKSRFYFNLILTIVLLSFVTAFSQTLTLDQIKQKATERINHRHQILQDYSCDLITERSSETPRGKMNSIFKFKVYSKGVDKFKAEFIEGERNGQKISQKDFQSGPGQRGRGGRGSGSRMSMFRPENEDRFDPTDFMSDWKLLGEEKLDGVAAYKVMVAISDKKHQLKEALIWLDASTFDLVKMEGKYRRGERIDSGSFTQQFAKTGAEGLWMPAEKKSNLLMVFQSPRGEMEIETQSVSKYENYQFNIGVSDDFFLKDK
ncbi:MAG: hypothetical protein SCK70_09365 [bacterium]|nr:hypothetical protein [bacterium]